MNRTIPAKHYSGPQLCLVQLCSRPLRWLQSQPLQRQFPGIETTLTAAALPRDVVATLAAVAEEDAAAVVVVEDVAVAEAKPQRPCQITGV